MSEVIDRNCEAVVHQEYRGCQPMPIKKLNLFANTDEIEQAVIGVVLYKLVGSQVFINLDRPPSHISEHRTHRYG